jgi:hypothetical protein
VDNTARPPSWYWWIPLAVAALRMLPVLSLRFATPSPGQSFLGVSYLPKDFLQYAAFSRQVAVDGSFFLANPFTTEPQSARFVLLFHWLLGIVARVTGLPALDVLEWSRVPLLVLFFATLWWFLRPVLSERKDRLAAAVLVGFAGGLESWVRPFGSGWLPASIDLRLQQDTSALHGWSAFASFYNPLWIAGLTLALLVRGRSCSPQSGRRGRSRRAASRSPRCSSCTPTRRSPWGPSSRCAPPSRCCSPSASTDGTTW